MNDHNDKNNAPKTQTESVDNTDQKEELLKKVQRDVEDWAYALIIMGVASIIFSNLLSPIWGGILIILGILTFTILEPSMYIILGLIIIMLSFKNSLATNSWWTLYSLLQLAIGVFLVQKFKDYKDYYKYFQNHSQKLFRFSIIFALLSLVFFGVTFYIVQDIKDILNPNSSIGRGFDMSWNMAILGVSFGFASFFSENLNKKILIIPAIINSLIFITYLIFVFYTLLS